MSLKARGLNRKY